MIQDLTQAYATLGLRPGADEATARAAFKVRAKMAHPDVGGTAAGFRAVEEAFHVIAAHGFPGPGPAPTDVAVARPVPRSAPAPLRVASPSLRRGAPFRHAPFVSAFGAAIAMLGVVVLTAAEAAPRSGAPAVGTPVFGTPVFGTSVSARPPSSPWATATSSPTLGTALLAVGLLVFVIAAFRRR